MGHQVIKLQNPLKTLGFLQFYRFKTVKDRIIAHGFLHCNHYFYFLFFPPIPSAAFHTNPHVRAVWRTHMIAIKKLVHQHYFPIYIP